ncbi:hypothetical protein A6770_30405 [Nostoc minutum NIES-26]|uniref:Tetratricopeptide repeat protein n=1 Tax=Nostoc minutum NIES-26 TaxID=1844469 RepID=A0A367QE63_9NOSO|nr:hypothetical protein A6770_30405 [Nostoc minutum NIES-26]
MHPFALTKRLIRFAVNHVVLFTLAFSLTIIPRTFAKQPQTNSPAGFYTQTTKPSTKTPQQLVSQGEALYQSGRFAEAVTVLREQRDLVRSDKKRAFTQCAAGIAKKSS